MMPDVHGEGVGKVDPEQAASAPPRRSRLSEYADMASEPVPQTPEQPSPQAPDASAAPSADDLTAVRPEEAEGADVAARRQAFAALLGEFRRTAVLVPVEVGPGPDEERGLLMADLSGIRFILAFSNEQALARYAQGYGELHREWTYRTILGAKLLDVAVPAAGVPCGVALDCADGPDGMVFPPVKGIVPDAVAVDVDVDADKRTAARA